MNQPNIFFIVLDTLRYDRLSCNGYNKQTSPNLDAFANHCISFKNAITSAPWSVPSHASLFTGRFSTEHGATSENPYLDGHFSTIAELLKKKNYDTLSIALSNAWLSKSTTNITKGFDQEFTDRKDAVRSFSMIDRIVYKIKSNLKRRPRHTQVAIKLAQNKLSQTRNNPLFLFMNLMDVHMPFEPYKSSSHKFQVNTFPEKDVTFLIKAFKKYRSKPESLTGLQIDCLNKLYDACVHTLDAQLLTLLNTIKKNDNTILIITSDHGESLGEHQLLSHWLSLYDTLIKVPLMIYLPNKKEGQVITEQVQLHNIFHTILDIVNFEDENHTKAFIQKNSLLAPNVNHKFVFSEHAYPKITLKNIKKDNPDFKNEKLECAKKSIRSNQYKYIYSVGQPDQLYNLIEDPDENKNITNEAPEITKELKERLFNKFNGLTKHSPDKDTTTSYDNTTQKKLEDLGYL
jgi:arylsulfatase A-like enzyme